tara:strand:- start:198 stop:422 length:225 start_codon:yes stop_codon:yes gene_type:complete
MSSINNTRKDNTKMHLQFIEDKNGDVVDANYYCSNFCHEEKEQDNYRGWNGCYEAPDYTISCNNCNEVINEKKG